MNERRILYEQINKACIAEMPIAAFEGRIRVIDTLPEAERAAVFLERQSCVGIDTETRPNFRRGTSHKVALLQVATHDLCLLFRLNRIGLPACVAGVLQNERIQKVGLSLGDDIPRLNQLAPLRATNCIDLQPLAARMGLKDMSLQKMYANFFHQKISKRQQLSNWEADVLTDAQKRYAATDAWACLKLYDEITQLQLTQNYQIIPHIPQPIQQQAHGL